MIGHQRPGIDYRAGISSDLFHSGYKSFSISCIINYLAFFNPSNDHIMQSSMGIQAGLTGHLITKVDQRLFTLVNYVPYAPYHYSTTLKSQSLLL